jgi:hypothetical protein
MPEKQLPVPDLLVERLTLGDLDPESAADVRARLQATGGAARVEEIATSNRKILDAHPAAVVLAEARQRLERAGRSPAPPARRGFLWSAGALGAVAAAAVIIVAIRRPGDPGADAPPPEVIRARGLRPHLIVYKKTADDVARLAPGGRARPGDLLQVAYVAAGRRYGIVASQDANGTVTFHLPTSGRDAVPLTDGGEVPAANAFELDASPGYERFVFVTSDQPFAASAVLDMLRGKKLPPGLSAMDLVLIKEVR